MGNNETNKELLILLDSLSEAFNINGITFSLAYGTLLGAYRDNRIIDWDNDIDLHISESDIKKLAQITLGRDIVISSVDNNFDFPYLAPRVYFESKGWFGPHIDIYPLISSRYYKESVIINICKGALKLKYVPFHEIVRLKSRIIKIFLFPLMIFPKSIILLIINLVLKRIRDDQGVYLYSYAGIYGSKEVIQKEILLPYDRIIFYKHIHLIPHNIVAYLTNFYGNFWVPRR